jgi:hypothetical protein
VGGATPQVAASPQSSGVHHLLHPSPTRRVATCSSARPTATAGWARHQVQSLRAGQQTRCADVTAARPGRCDGSPSRQQLAAPRATSLRGARVRHCCEAQQCQQTRWTSTPATPETQATLPCRRRLHKPPRCRTAVCRSCAHGDDVRCSLLLPLLMTTTCCRFAPILSKRSREERRSRF